MEMREERTGHNLVVALIGKLDVYSSSDVEARLLDAIDDNIKTLILDVSGLEFISSTGMRVFIIASKRIQSLGGKMVFASVGPNIQKILEISGFSKMFKIVATPRDAYTTH